MGVADDESVGAKPRCQTTPKGSCGSAALPVFIDFTFSSSQHIHTHDSFFQRYPVQVSAYLLRSSLYDLISSPKSELGLVGIVGIVGIVASVLHVFDAISGCWLCLSCVFAF